MSLILRLEENQYIAIDFQDKFVEIKTNLLSNHLWSILEPMDFNKQECFLNIGFRKIDHHIFRNSTSPSEFGRFYEKEDKCFIFVNPYNGKEFNSFY